MARVIHPSAVIESGAEIGEDVEIGPFCYIGSEVRIGARTVIQHHATLEGFTELGEENQVFPYACLGGKTHDLKYRGGRAGLRIGHRNVFREYVTAHLATNDAEFTVLGDDNVILAYSHIAHDCQVGNRLVMSSHSALGGHVVTMDHCNIGWGVGVHQFCRIGSFAMVGACSKVVQDVPPFLIADGNPAVIRSFKKVGLERARFTSEQIDAVKFAFKTLYREGLNRSQAMAKLLADPRGSSAEVQAFVQFADKSERGFAPGAARE
jgi:UDP-N-acetylglucosamine acyltransferase